MSSLTSFKVTYLVVALLLILIVANLFVVSYDSHKQSFLVADSPPVKLVEGWEYRWGDSPIDASGTPTWLYDDLTAPAWQPLPSLEFPSDALGRTNLWVRIKLPAEGQ
jgi:hypothetical protein